jgi:hypothetical protein
MFDSCTKGLRAFPAGFTPAFNVNATMKHVVKLGAKQYVTLDSYGGSYETRRKEQVIVLILGILVAALSIGALMGADITQFEPQLTNGQPRN